MDNTDKLDNQDKQDNQDNQYEWKLCIKRVNNGYIFSGRYDGTDIPYQEVQELDNHIESGISEDNRTELEGYKELGYRVLEYFGLQNSKHNKYNLEINIKQNNEK